MITAITFGVVGFLTLMAGYVITLHSKVVSETTNHISLSPWHIVCLAIALLLYAVVGASLITSFSIAFVLFATASVFSVVAFGIVIKNLRGRLKNGKANSMVR